MSELVPFDVGDADASPFVQFERWFDEARGSARDLDAVALATASASGQPSLRMVLLRRRDARGYGFFTNYDSHKAHDLAENPRAAILWFNEAHGRQVRIEGTVAKMEAAESDEYFAARPRAHQIGAIASRQSSVLGSRGELEARVIELTARYEGVEIARPANWGGYRLTPTRFEFWQMREDRLHDRVVYDPAGGAWTTVRYCP